MSQPVRALPAMSVTVSVAITTQTTTVDGSSVRYSTGGEGPVVLFLHGWGLGHNAYRRGLRRLAARGYRVVAPALPGFGGTAELADDQQSLRDYASWTERFCDAVGITERVVVVGHSFGGGVSTQFGADFPESVRAIVLLNSVGGEWFNDGTTAPMVDRPWWDWARHIPADVAALVSNFASTMPSVLEDLVANVVRNPFGVAKVGRLARSADLSGELCVLRRRRLPALVVHSHDDGVIPPSSFRSMCDLLGQEGRVVAGNHSWPMTHPDLFADVVAQFIESIAVPSRRRATQ